MFALPYGDHQQRGSNRMKINTELAEDLADDVVEPDAPTPDAPTPVPAPEGDHK